MQVRADFDEVIVRKYPEQVAIAIAKDPQGKYNPITLGWVMPTSIRPPMMAVSVGQARYSSEAIRHAGAFVVSFPSTDMEEDALFHGTNSGRDMDKLKVFGTRTRPAAVIDGVLFEDAVANFECTLESEHPTGDHVIFVGKVVAAHQNDDPAVRRVYAVGAGYAMDGVLAG